MTKKKKEQSVLPTQKYFKIHTFSSTSQTGSGEDSNEPYRYRGSTHTTWSIDGVEIVEKDEHNCLPARFEIEEGKFYYLLYGVYSTGDSFGHDADAELELVEVFKDRTVAEVAAKTLREHHELANGRSAAKPPKNFNMWSCSIKVDDGTSVDISIPWNGYFENLSYLEIYPFQIGGYKTRF